MHPVDPGAGQIGQGGEVRLASKFMSLAGVPPDWTEGVALMARRPAPDGINAPRCRTIQATAPSSDLGRLSQIQQRCNLSGQLVSRHRLTQQDRADARFASHRRL